MSAKKTAKITCEICHIKTYRSGNEKRLFVAKFPLDKDRCKKWLAATGNIDLIYVPIEKLHQLKYVCGKHFRPKDFKKKRTQLRKTAVPSIDISLNLITEEMMKDFPLHVAQDKTIYVSLGDHNYCSRDMKGLYLHVFPNPDKDPKRFESWVNVAKAHLNTPNDKEFYRKKRVCNKHFTEDCQVRNNRISANAIPTLNIHGDNEVKTISELDESLPILHYTEFERDSTTSKGGANADSVSKAVLPKDVSAKMAIKHDTGQSQAEGSTATEVESNSSQTRSKSMKSDIAQEAISQAGLAQEANTPLSPDPLRVDAGYEVDLMDTDMMTDDESNADAFHTSDDELDDDFRPESSDAGSDSDIGDNAVTGDFDEIPSKKRRLHTDTTALEQDTTKTDAPTQEVIISDYRQNGLCRCCLKEDLHRVVNVTDVLDCLNILPSREPRLQPLVCDSCWKFLKEVDQFRTMVAASETTLLRTLYGSNAPISELCFDTSDQVVGNEATDISGLIKQEANIAEDNARFLQPAVPRLPSASAAAADDDDAHLQDMAFSEISDDTDFDIKSLYNEKEVAEFLSRQRERKNEQLRHILENIVSILQYSTIVPFSYKTKEFECIYSDACYAEFSELKKHMASQHSSHDADEVLDHLEKNPQNILRAETSCLQCKLCNAQLSNIEVLVKHLVNVHNKKFNDTSCDPPHNIVDFDFSDNKMKCSVCGKVFSSFKALLPHMNEHYGSYLCPHCGRKFISQIAYRNHTLLHEKPLLPCDMCSEGFISVYELKRHKKAAHNFPILSAVKLETVSKSSQPQSALSTRIEDPIGEEKECECKLCDAQFNNTSALFVHRLQHLQSSTEKPYKCEMCEYTTEVRYSFITHLQRHFGIKTYACNICDKRFVSRKSCNKHAKSHQLQLECPLCGTGFMDVTKFGEHVTADHPGYMIQTEQTEE